jgi:DUF1009 family protein
MPSGPQSRLKHSIKQLGIIAGRGRLPALLLDHCDARGITPFIIGLKGQTDPALLTGRNHILIRLGAAGAMVHGLKERGISDMVMIGAVRRPSLLDLRPDWYAAKFLAGVPFSKLGDDGLLKAIRRELETREGIVIHGIQDFIDDILMTDGLIGGPAPDAAALQDIQAGIAASQILGRADKGQSVIVKDGRIIGEEGPRGTDALIEDKGCATAILVKTCKPQQDRDMDLPTIGPDTVQACADKGMKGIALESGAAFLVDREDVKKLADQTGVFVTGVKVDRHAG